MSTKQKKLVIALGGTILVCMLTCAAFGWKDSRHAHAWNNAFDGFKLLGIVLILFFLFKFPGNRPVPDTLTRLFPKPTQEPPEGPKQ